MSERPRVHVLGCGRAGRVVLRWLHERGRVQVGQIVNRRLDSARQAVAFIGAGEAVERFRSPLEGDWLLLGLPDDQLAEAVNHQGLRPAIAFHLSGALPAEVMPIEAAARASLHPAKAFADPTLALVSMGSCRWTVQGDSQALQSLQATWAVDADQWLTVSAKTKATYHAATVCASNFLVTLTALARSLAEHAGLSENASAGLIGDLQRATLTNLEGRSAAQALTGPIERGDARTLERLLGALPDAESEVLFTALSEATLALARQGRGPRPGDEAIKAMLCGDRPRTRPDPVD